MDPSPAKQIAAPTPNFLYAVRVTNDGTADVTVTVTAGPTMTDTAVPCPTDKRCTLGWRLGKDALPVGQPTALTLTRGQSKLLTYEGRAEALGNYQSDIVILEGTEAPKRHTVYLKRSLVELGAAAVVVGPVTVRTLGPFGGAQAVPVTVTNTSADAIDLSGLEARLLRDEGGSTYGNTINQQAVCKAAIGRLTPGESKVCEVALPKFPTPGHYRLSLSAAAHGVKNAQASDELGVRYSWLYALLLLLVGGVGGRWVARYQNGGRRRALQMALALRWIDAANQLLKGAGPASRTILDKLVGDLNAIVDELRAVATADRATDIDSAGIRLPALARFVVLEKSYIDLPSDKRPATQYGAARQAVGAGVLPGDAATKLDALETAIAAVQPKDARRAASAARLFIDWESRSPAEVEKGVRRMDDFLEYLSLALAAVIGVVTLWQPNMAWGSVGDMLVAIFTGAAGTVTGALGLKELVSGYRLGTIAPQRASGAVG